jgi:hypothetical protein
MRPGGKPPDRPPDPNLLRALHFYPDPQWTEPSYIATMQYMDAVLLAKAKEVRDDGSIVEIVVWEVPEPIPPSKHGFKYRLYYGTNGLSRVRYDNERGKGDHRHIGEREEDYLFTTLEGLLQDFERDVQEWSPA